MNILVSTIFLFTNYSRNRGKKKSEELDFYFIIFNNREINII